MKKFLAMVVLVFLLSARGECFNPFKWIFGGGKTEVNTNIQGKDSVNKKLSDNIIDLKEAIKAEVTMNNSLQNQLEMKNEMIANFKTEIEMKNTAYDKSVNKTETLQAQNDIIQNTVNESSLMLSIFKGLLRTFGAIILALIAAIKFVYSGMLTRLKEKDNYSLKLEEKRQQYRTMYLRQINPKAAQEKEQYEKDNKIDS